MAIPNGVIFIWTGTNASIPAGWQRVTDLDGKFPKGNTDGSTNPNVTGGTSTHTHTSPTHTHTINAHTHTTITNNGSGGGTQTESGTNSAPVNHAHANVESGAVTSASVSSVAVTYGSVSNNPPFYSVIYITPASTVGGIPNLSLGLSDDSSFTNNTGKYNGYYKCDGNNSTPDLTDRYLVGASALANAGTTGGSLTNVHNIDHTHTQSHSHANATTGDFTGGVFKSGGGPLDLAVSHTHTHVYSTNSTSITTSGLTVTTTETVEPAFKKLLAIQNRSGTIYTPIGIIALWLGTIANIPTNFEIVSSMYDKHLKITNTNGDIGNTGGSNTHTHSNNGHNHSLSHTHTVNNHGHTQTADNNGSGNLATTSGTTHTVTVNSTTMTTSTNNTSADSSSNEPEFRTVAFIKYKGEKGGSFIFNLLR